MPTRRAMLSTLTLTKYGYPRPVSVFVLLVPARSVKPQGHSRAHAPWSEDYRPTPRLPRLLSVDTVEEAWGRLGVRGDHRTEETLTSENVSETETRT